MCSPAHCLHYALYHFLDTSYSTKLDWVSNSNMNVKIIIETPLTNPTSLHRPHSILLRFRAFSSGIKSRRNVNGKFLLMVLQLRRWNDFRVASAKHRRCSVFDIRCSVRIHGDLFERVHARNTWKRYSRNCKEGLGWFSIATDEIQWRRTAVTTINNNDSKFHIFVIKLISFIAQKKTFCEKKIVNLFAECVLQRV